MHCKNIVAQKYKAGEGFIEGCLADAGGRCAGSVFLAFFCSLIIVLFFPSTSRVDGLLLWNANAQAKLSRRWEVKVEVEEKFRDCMSELYDVEFMPWAAYRFTDWFKLGLDQDQDPTLGGLGNVL
jgi:hypothetical protein